MRLLLASSLLYLLLSLAVTQSASPLSSSTPSTTPTTSQPLALQSPCRVGSFHDTTSNELLQENECRPLTLIFARGSQEVGNMGTRVGPSLARAMQALLGPDRVTVQGVNEYPAILYEALHGVGSVSGSRWLAEAIRLTKEKCPETYLAIGGYSQGAMVSTFFLGPSLSDAMFQTRNKRRNIFIRSFYLVHHALLHLIIAILTPLHPLIHPLFYIPIF